MRPLLGYYARMRYWAAVSAVLACALAVPLYGQINGVPASVTSYGFGGHVEPNAPRASVTSLGPNGFNGSRFGTIVPPGRPDHRHRDHTYFPGYYYPYYPVIDPYMYSGPADSASSASEPDQYQGGPTIFDRRGTGERYPNDYGRQPQPAPDNAATASALQAPAASISPAPSSPEPAQPETILIFKDGHKQEIGNYAIVGASLFDLSSGRRQKIAIADLDVPATEKANEAQGVDFKLPVLPAGS